MDFSKFEASAKEKAAIHVAHMLHTPDKLEKVRFFSISRLPGLGF